MSSNFIFNNLKFILFGNHWKHLESAFDHFSLSIPRVGDFWMPVNPESLNKLLLTAWRWCVSVWQCIDKNVNKIREISCRILSLLMPHKFDIKWQSNYSFFLDYFEENFFFVKFFTLIYSNDQMQIFCHRRIDFHLHAHPKGS